MREAELDARMRAAVVEAAAQAEVEVAHVGAGREALQCPRARGRPLKLIFDREADSRFDCARSPTVCTFAASFSEQGALTGVEHAAVAGWPTLSMAPAPTLGFGDAGAGGIGAAAAAWAA